MVESKLGQYPIGPLKVVLDELAKVIEQNYPTPDGYKYVCAERFVFDLGRVYVPFLKPEKYSFGEARQCFVNSAELAEKYGLVFVEGFARAQNTSLVVHHAWCVEKGSDRVIDVSWKEPGSAYFGVPFANEFVKRRARKKNGFGGVLDLEHGYSLFENGATGWQHEDK